MRVIALFLLIITGSQDKAWTERNQHSMYSQKELGGLRIWRWSGTLSHSSTTYKRKLDAWRKLQVQWDWKLTLSPLMPLRFSTLPCWSNLLFLLLIFGRFAAAPKCQKLWVRPNPSNSSSLEQLPLIGLIKTRQPKQHCRTIVSTWPLNTELIYNSLYLDWQQRV